ncbi:MAG: hypothetical protein QG637_587, partial [Chloroflexota bacterium]|nr:hypothetical protein [Chloroflexota bacterium]
MNPGVLPKRLDRLIGRVDRTWAARLLLAIICTLMIPGWARANHPTPFPDDITTPNITY